MRTFKGFDWHNHLNIQSSCWKLQEMWKCNHPSAPFDSWQMIYLMTHSVCVSRVPLFESALLSQSSNLPLLWIIEGTVCPLLTCWHNLCPGGASGGGTVLKGNAMCDTWLTRACRFPVKSSTASFSAHHFILSQRWLGSCDVWWKPHLLNRLL